MHDSNCQLYTTYPIYFTSATFGIVLLLLAVGALKPRSLAMQHTWETLGDVGVTQMS